MGSSCNVCVEKNFLQATISRFNLDGLEVKFLQKVFAIRLEYSFFLILVNYRVLTTDGTCWVTITLRKSSILFMSANTMVGLTVMNLKSLIMILE